jgi:hypothetical protein
LEWLGIDRASLGDSNIESDVSNAAQVWEADAFAHDLIEKAGKHQVAEVARLLALNIGWYRQRHGDVTVGSNSSKPYTPAAFNARFPASTSRLSQHSALC